MNLEMYINQVTLILAKDSSLKVELYKDDIVAFWENDISIENCCNEIIGMHMEHMSAT